MRGFRLASVFSGVAGVAILAVAGSGGPAMADRLVLTSGEALEGKVIEQSAERVVFEHALLGRFTLTADAIATVTLTPPEAPPPEAEQAPEVEQAAAKVEPVAAPASDVEPVAPPALASPLLLIAPPAPPAAAVTPPSQAGEESFLRSLPERLLDGWKTQLSFGFTGYDGQKEQRDFYGKLDTAHAGPPTTWKFFAESFFSDSPQGTTRDEGRLELTRRAHSADGPWFFFTTGRYQYNRFRDWEDRFGGYAGFGGTVDVTENFEFTTEAGLGGSYEDGTVQDWTPEAVFAAGGMLWTLTPRQTLRFDSRWFPSLEDFSQYRLEAEADWSFKVDARTNTHLNLGVRQQYERTAPRADRSDLKYFAALKFSF